MPWIRCGECKRLSRGVCMACYDFDKFVDRYLVVDEKTQKRKKMAEALHLIRERFWNV